MQTNRSWFDDSPEHRQILGGLYATVASRLDLFGLYTEQKVRLLQRGVGRATSANPSAHAHRALRPSVPCSAAAIEADSDRAR